MTSYLCIIQYVGTNYFGWQIQKNASPTIQGQLTSCLQKIFSSKEVKVTGSGRTDRGVHAFSQVAKLEVPRAYPVDKLKRALNSLLGPEIHIDWLWPCQFDFHPTHHALMKEYVYRISRQFNPFSYGKDTFVSYALDVEKMKLAAKLFEGDHDFVNFRCMGTPTKTTVRRIYLSELEVEGPTLQFRVRGSGFLKQMVRIMAGSLLEVGKGRKSLKELQFDLTGESKEKAAPVAPAEGLYLNRVDYPQFCVLGRL